MELEVVHPACAGLDVHKKTVVACALTPAGREVRSFRAMTAGLQELADWLAQQQVSQVVMEATGVYWRPVYNLLEGRFTVVVANAAVVRGIPGRKTDVKDAEWLATLLRHGLVPQSFIPSREQRELRDLTRYRTSLLQERAREANRLQKTLEGANIKLAAVISDTLGVSGQRILDALTQGWEDPAALADLAHWRVQRNRVALEEALAGQLSPTLRFLIQVQLGHIRSLDDQIAACDVQVAALLTPFAAALARLRTIPGVGQRTAEVILAELGADMTRFATHRHAAAWSGMCPGNRQSGGKRREAPTRKGSPWLRAAFAEAAWAASHCKDGYLPALYRRLAARRGKKRAIVATGHAILVIAYHLLRDGGAYTDLGATYFDQRDRDAVRRRAIQRLEGLGYRVHIEPLPEVA